MNDAHKPASQVYSAKELRPLRPGEVPPGYEYVASTGDYVPLAPSESACPTCGRKPPAPKKKSKLRGSKTIKVPKDAQEDGVELLENLIAQSEEKLYPDMPARSPYYTLLAALYFFVTNYAGEPA